MKSFLLVFIVLLTITFSVKTAQAQDVTYITEPPTFELAEPLTPSRDSIPNGAFITPMQLGQRASYPGVLYSLEANAWLLSEIERLQLFWILEMNTRVNLILTWANHELASQENRNNASIEIIEVQLRTANRNIENLSDTNRELAAQVGWTRREKFRFVVSVIGVGALAGVGGYFLGRISR